MRMFRLILLLLVGLGAAMLTGGRDLSPEEMAALGRTPAEPHRKEAVQPAAAPPAARTEPVVEPVAAETPASDTLTLATIPARPAAPAVPGDAVQAAVEVAMATDTPAEPKPEADPSGDVAALDAPSIDEEIDAALSDSQVWFVNANRVNVREGPSTGYEVVGQVVFGEATEILSDPEADWVRIRIQGDGVEGYVARQFLQDSEPGG